MITIHFNDTTLDVQESDDSYRYRSLMGDHNLTLKFSLPEYVEIPVGAWCEYMAIRYTLAAPANITKNGTRDIEYTLIMESAQYQLNRYKLRNTVDKRLKFSMCATPKEYIQVIVDNLNQRDSGWTVGDCIVSTEKTIAFDHSYVSDALQSVADTFNTEWEIVGKTIHLKKVEYFKDDPLPLSYGKGNGFVPGVGRTTESGSRPVEILFVQGGSQNIDRSKYGSAELLLPKSQTLEYEGRTYISDADGYSIRRQDKAVLYNNEDSLDCSEIYPSRVGKVTKVEVIDEANNFYDIIDNTIPESLNYNDYLIEGENMTIIFQSGMLAGDNKAFELKYSHAERRFEIVPQEINGLTMPGGVYIPHEGDTYAIFGCMLPDAYICDNATKTGASWDMFREAARYLYENEDTKFTFSGELQGMWAKRNWLKVGGKLVVGGYVLFTDNQFAPDGVKIRITGIKDYLTSPYAPTVELSNSVSGKSLNSTLNELENGNVIVDENQKKIIQFTKRRFRDSLETIDMLEQALLENFTNSINPIAVQTMAMLVGDESLQFRFVDSNLNPIQYHITYNQGTKQLIAPATVLQHMTLGIDTITSSRDKNTYKHWTMSGYTSPVLDQISQKYYFYAKVPTGTGTGEFVLSPTAIGMNDVSGYYHLLVGILNSEYDGVRSFATLYGFTEVLPGRITTDRVVSGDGNSYFDMKANAMRLGDALDFNSKGDRKLRLRGTIVQSQSGDESYIGCYRGNYNDSYTYYNGDEVSYAYNGGTSTYRMINDKPCKGIAPTDSIYWHVAAQGTKGDYTEYRYAKNNSVSDHPLLYKNIINPPDWVSEMPTVESSEYLWMTSAVKSGDGKSLLSEWATPVRITPYNGKDGTSPVAIFRGVYSASRVYYGDSKRVDVVNYGGGYYKTRSNAGTFTGIAPNNPGKWEYFGAQFESIATELLLAENANLAGFIFKNNMLISQKLGNDGKPMLQIDGVNGEITAYKGIWKGSIWYDLVEPANSEVLNPLSPNVLLRNGIMINNEIVYLPKITDDIIGCYFNIFWYAQHTKNEIDTKAINTYDINDVIIDFTDYTTDEYGLPEYGSYHSIKCPLGYYGYIQLFCSESHSWLMLIKTGGEFVLQ